MKLLKMKHRLDLFCIVALCAAGLADDAKAADNWVLHNDAPAKKWVDSFVTGNGKLGTMVRGLPGRETITCVQEELFIRSWDRSVVAVPEIADHLPKVRAALAGDNPADAREAAGQAAHEARRQLDEKGASQVYPMVPHPAFDLVMDIEHKGRAVDYRRSLDLETGEARVVWRDEQGGVEEAVFSSRPHNVNVIRLRGTDGKRLNGTIELMETPGRTGQVAGHDVAEAFATIRTEAEPAQLYYYADYAHDRGGYEGIVRVEVKQGTARAEGTQIHIEGAEEVLILMRIHFLDDASQPRRARVGKELAELPADYDRLLAAHAAEHGEMFRRVTLNLGTADLWDEQTVSQLIERSAKDELSPLFLEQAFAAGRYLLISTCGRYPAPLQGIWGASWRPAWAGNFTMDSNVNLAISAASMGNLPECAESYFGFIERMLPGWRKNAKAIMGTRGFLASINPDPETGYLNHFKGPWVWMYWVGGAGWNIRPFYQHALLTGDRQFMKNRVLPLYREMALFYEDFLVEGEDGLYHIIPGISPENFNKAGLVAADTTFDVAVAREVFTVLIECAEQFDLDPQDIKRWQTIRSRLPDYRINGEGALAEWIPDDYSDKYGHRHNSHLYPVFPGLEFNRPDTDPELLQAARVALDKRLEHDTTSAHGLMYAGLMAARLKDVNKVLMQLNRLSGRRFYNDGFTTAHYPDKRTFNLDAALSLPRLVMEMLVFSLPDRIELMPAWPEQAGKNGVVKGILARGGFEVDLAWAEGRLTEAVIRSNQGGNTRVVYADKSIELKTVPGGEYRLDGNLELK
jgi:hypothetical protein